jgi:hypothetical protein
MDALEALKVDNDTFARESQFLMARMRIMGLPLVKSFVTRDIAAAWEHYGHCVTSPRLPSPSSGPTVSD